MQKQKQITEIEIKLWKNSYLKDPKPWFLSITCNDQENWGSCDL